MSANVIVWGIPGRQRLSHKGGVQGLLKENLGMMCGPQ